MSLQVAYMTGMAEDERGGVAVVLLQGWGAPADDLVPLGKALVRPGLRAFVPGAPLPELGGGRAWWHLNDDDRPAWSWEGKAPDGYTPHRLVSAARLEVQTLLAAIREQYAPELVVLGGFSQGAMLALDVALRPGSGVDRVAALSGVLIADTALALDETPQAEDERPALLVTHGEWDQALPFSAGEQAKDVLAGRGYQVDWLPFEGGHEIPGQVLEALRALTVDA
ncbi:alpha/beta hydrolase [Longispora albida]|uniref:alpha/beta hydrolase n=1 Tax=Longispora albida TaxID=203523 RepID=UPI0012F99B8D|nr:hypothetical protein [Longispora albida]